jgi:hypothetical protein
MSVLLKRHANPYTSYRITTSTLSSLDVIYAFVIWKYKEFVNTHTYTLNSFSPNYYTPQVTAQIIQMQLELL